MQTRDVQDPIGLFREWRRLSAHAGDLSHPDAMCLCTVDSAGLPDARFVTLKAVRDDGFVFCTSYGSPKSLQIERNPSVALTFWWDHVGRQVRVVGSATRIGEADADAFFRRRSRDAQLATWAFEQSRALSGDRGLADHLDEARRKFASRDVPRPSDWGGYSVAPRRIEFLAFDVTRVHRRVAYELLRGEWVASELQP